MKRLQKIKDLRWMISDANINGAKYFIRVQTMIEDSKLNKKDKAKLIKELEKTSGMVW